MKLLSIYNKRDIEKQQHEQIAITIFLFLV